MKILILNPFSKFAAVRQFNISKKFAEMGNETILMLPKYDQYSGFQKVPIEEVNNLRIIHPFQIKSKLVELSMLFYIPSAIIKTLFKKIDVIHATRPLPFSGLLGYIISKLKRKPFVLEIGDIEWETMADLKHHPSYRVKIVKYLEKYLTENADGIIVFTDSVKDYLLENYNVKDKKMIVVSNGVDSDLFKPKEEKELNLVLRQKTNSKKIITYVGKLDNIDHIKDMIKVISRLPKEYGMVVVGEGKGKNQLIELAEDNNLENRIFFVGRVQNYDVPKYLNASDILFAPFSNTKGVNYASNLKLFEYMAMEKPIIASDVGKIKEILEGKGYVYKSGNVQEIIKIFKNIDLNIGKKARKEVLKKYDWNVLSKKLLDFYGKLK